MNFSNFIFLKVSKSRKQFLEFLSLPKNERKTKKKYPKSSRDNFFCFRSFFGRIEETINCFRDLLTFNKPKLRFVNKFLLTQIYDSISLFKHREWVHAGAPYPVRLARPWPYLDFEKEKAAAARRHYRGLTWLGRARCAGGAPVVGTRFILTTQFPFGNYPEKYSVFQLLSVISGFRSQSSFHTLGSRE